MTDQAPDAKVFGQSFGLDGGAEDVALALDTEYAVLSLDTRPMQACIDRMDWAMEGRPDIVARVSALMVRAEKGVEAIGTTRVARCGCGCGQLVLEVHPSRDLLDFMAEIEAAE